MSSERINIVQGEFAVSSKTDAVISTLLGSCVAVCMHDEVAGVGGMNHFLLPGDARESSATAGSPLGVYLMEMLINALLKTGADRRRLQAKIFGGASIVRGLSDIGPANVKFAYNFLAHEKIRIVGGHTGGGRGRRLQFWPSTGRVRQLMVSASAEEPIILRLEKPMVSSDAGELELF
jgi:chemotaxis protein CheD